MPTARLDRRSNRAVLHGGALSRAPGEVGLNRTFKPCSSGNSKIFPEVCRTKVKAQIDRNSQMKKRSAFYTANISFRPLVKVATECPGRSTAVHSVDRASEILLSWGVRNHAWIKAADLCEAASEGRASAAEAREAFRRAAAEAGMLRIGSY